MRTCVCERARVSERARARRESGQSSPCPIMTTLTSLSGQSANAPKQSAGTGKIVFFLRSPATNASSCAKYGFCTSFASTCSQAGGSESPCFARSAPAAVVDRAAEAEAEAEAEVEEDEDEEEDDEDEDEDALVVFARFGVGTKNELILPDFRDSIFVCEIPQPGTAGSCATGHKPFPVMSNY